MKVVLFRPICGTGGIMSWMVSLAVQLRGWGVSCDFWFCRGSTRMEDFERLGGVHVEPMPEFLEQLARGAYDVVHVINQDAAAELIAAVRPAPRIIVTSQGELGDGWQSNNCFAYTAVSRDMARVNQPLTDLEVEVIPNGVDAGRFSPPPGLNSGPPIVAWVGRSRDIQQKDFPRFTRIAAILAGKGVRLWVADAHGASWKDFENHDRRRVEFERWERVPYETMPQFYRDVAASGGALLMTSTHEGLPFVSIEAAAAGTTTVAPDVFGVRESMFPGVTGTLFDPRATDQEVADLTLEWIAGRRNRPDAIAACAAAAGDAFSLETMSRRYLDIYERPSQKLRTGTPEPWDENAPGMRELLARFRDTHRERADVLSQGASRLASHGHAAMACRALRSALAASPGYFARPAGWKRLASVGAKIVTAPFARQNHPTATTRDK